MVEEPREWLPSHFYLSHSSEATREKLPSRKFSPRKPTYVLFFCTPSGAVYCSSGGDTGRPLDSTLASRVPLGNGLSLRDSEQGESQLLHLPGAPGIDWHLIIVCDKGTCADFIPSLYQADVSTECGVALQILDCYTGILKFCSAKDAVKHHFKKLPSPDRNNPMVHWEFPVPVFPACIQSVSSHSCFTI